MNTEPTLSGTTGATTEPSQPLPPKPPPPAAREPELQLAKYVEQAETAFARTAAELVGVERRNFFLKLCITLYYIWLKIGAKDAYVDKVLAELRKQHEGKWVVDISTFQHYELPMRGYMRELARLKNPEDPNLVEKFSIGFLREHLEYMINEDDLTNLLSEVDSLTKFDRRFGNDRVNPAKPAHDVTNDKAKQSKAKSTASDAKDVAGIARTKRRPASNSVVPLRKIEEQDEPDPPTSDQLLEQIYVVIKMIDAMKAAGVPVNPDIKEAMRTCYGKFTALHVLKRAA